MKQMEVTEKRIGESTFYIKPFPAFVSANISGELAALIAPMLGGLAPLAGSVEGGDLENFDISNVNVEDALPAVSDAFAGLSGDKFEKLMKKLLIDHKNISVECEATNGEVKPLTYELANEVFCMEIEDMYILCFEVVRLNFGGFFKKLGTRFGGRKEDPLKKVPSTSDSES